MRALLEYGEHPDMLVGTSIGAWNAAWLARMPTLAGVEQLAEVWRGLRPAQVLLGRGSSRISSLMLRCMLLVSALRRIANGSASLYSDVGMRQIVAQYLGDDTFEQLALPLRVIATDLSHGGRAVFKSGAVAPAVLASSAIPGIFPPVRIGNNYYADGGAVDGCSIETAVELGAQRIFVLAIGYDTEGDGGAPWVSAARSTSARWPTSRSTAAAIQRASQVMGNYQIQRALERVPAHVETHIISLATGDGGGTLSFRDTSTWIERAYFATRDYLRAALPAERGMQSATIHTSTMAVPA
jgi:NTE family protein